jgi:hypothetical protein
MTGSGTRPSHAVSITRARRWLVHAVIVLVVGGQLYAVVRARDYWPFSNYGMFSYVDESQTHNALRLFRIRGSEELPLLAFDHLRPFDQARITTVLELIKDSDPSGSKVRAALRDIWVRYEEGRQAGRHRGPLVDGVRLYTVEWKLDPFARNVSAPEQRDLLAEFRPHPDRLSR